MATVRFTKNLARHLPIPEAQISGAKTVRELLTRLFAEQPVLGSYVLDDQGVLRHHMIVFVDGQQIKDRLELSDPIAEGSEIYVMQALSGG